jgi:hypothetical protein
VHFLGAFILSDVEEKWEKFLRPDLIRMTFSVLGLYMVAYEFLVDGIRRRPKEYYATQWSAKKGWALSDDYRKNVLSLDPQEKNDALRGALAWFRNLEAIDDSDLKAFHSITVTRNTIAHEISKIISGESKVELETMFPLLFDLILKVERWWVINVEIATDPDMADKEIDEDGVTPGSILVLQILHRVALGEDDEAWELYRMFAKRGENV